MDEQELRKLLQESIKLGRENNLMLRKLVWAERRSAIMRVIYWLLIIAASVAAYYVLQPYINDIMKLYSSPAVSAVMNTVK